MKNKNKKKLYVGGYDVVTRYKTLCLKVSEFEKINDISNNDFRGLLTHAKTVYFLIDFYLRNKPKQKKETKVESALPYDPTAFLSQ